MLETNLSAWGLTRLEHLPMPQGLARPEDVPGLTFFAGRSRHEPNPRLVAQLTFTTRGEVAVERQAVANAEDVVKRATATADAEATKAAEASEECAREKDAAAALAKGKSELEKAEAKLAAAQKKFDTALEKAKDPRSHRAELNAAKDDADDCRKWVARLVAEQQKAAGALARVRGTAYGAALKRLQPSAEALANRRAALKTQAEAALLKFTAELLEIDATERAIKGNVTTRPAAPTNIEDKILAGTI